MKKALLDEVLEKAIEEAMAGLAARAKAIVEESLGRALEARLKVLLGEETPAQAAPAPARAKAKAQATPLEGATPTLAQEEATPTLAKAPRKRKAGTQANPAKEEDLAAILDAAKVALEKYRGAKTPKGKPLEEVLLRRIRKTLQYAKEDLGRTDLPSLARSALAVISTDPMAAAMGSWQALAGRLGLPVPIQGQG